MRNSLIIKLKNDIRNLKGLLKVAEKTAPQLYYYKWGNNIIYERLYKNSDAFESDWDTKSEEELIRLKAEKLYYNELED